MPKDKELEPRLNNVEEKINRLGERVATLEGRLAERPEEKKSPLTLVNALITVFFLAALWYWGWVGTSVVAIREHLSSLETSVNDTKRIQALNTLDSAEQQAKSGNKAIATTRVEQTTALLQNATKQKIPAPPAFFEQSVRALNQLATAEVDRNAVNQAMIQLAEYRSALLTPLTPSGKTITISD